MADETARLVGIEAFKDLPEDALRELDSRLKLIELARGACLINQGDEADALYLVVSGRFDVLVEGRDGPIAMIGPGNPIGEIAFFTGGRRTATVRAARDSLVLRLSREDFDSLAERSPRIWSVITPTLARRLAETTASGERARRPARPRTLAIVQAGAKPVPQAFIDTLADVLAQRQKIKVLGREAFEDAAHTKTADATRWLNALEGEFDMLVYLADTTLTSWSEKAIRQADMVLCVGDAAAAEGAGAGAADIAPGTLERFAAQLHQPGQIRLALLHGTPGRASGTRHWLDSRPFVGMHHHLSMDTRADYQRLARFIEGRALGFVACGGGAFTVAHIGIYQAFTQAGLVFDMLGGTSGGSAMTAAFARGAPPDEIEARTHEIFVARKSLRRWTVPRYSLLDHREFDAALEDHYTNVDIEDLWLPYFAVSTNLSESCLKVHRRGPVWEAVRASSAIPALLPPVFDEHGLTLVDGAILDNVPISTMRSLKSGPNIVVDFQMPPLERCHIDRRALPRREALLRAWLTRAGRNALPAAPSPQVVLMRALMLERRDLEADMGEEDILLRPTPPAHLTHMDWHAHAELRKAGHDFACAEIERLRALGRLPVITDA